MADVYDPATRRRVMAAVASRDTEPEIAVRKVLHAEGFRFRLHRRDLPGRPDVVLPRYRFAVFVHGCFWHDHGCSRARRPRTNSEYWDAKRQRNRARDARAQEQLRAAGWDIAIIWTCEQESGTRSLLACLKRLRDQRGQMPLSEPLHNGQGDRVAEP